MDRKELMIVSRILDCGMNDLQMLFDMDQDTVLDAIEAVRDEERPLTLATIMEEAVLQSLDYFADGLPKEEEIECLKDEISNIEEAIREVDQEIDELVTNEPLFVDESGDYLAKAKLDEEKQELEDRADELKADIDEIRALDPQEDFEYYFNFLDTHLYITKHDEVYRKYFADEISDMEYRVGLAV